MPMTRQSPQHRRDILDRLRSSETIGPGPLVSGLRESDRIVVTSFYSPYACQHYRRALAAVGVRSWTKRSGAKTSVEVSYSNRDVAWQIAARQTSEYPDRRPSSKRGAFDFTILGGISGAMVGVVSFRYALHGLLWIGVWAGFIGSGVLVGLVVDRINRSFRYLGHLRCNVVDCLLLTTATAVVLAFWTFLSRLL